VRSFGIKGRIVLQSDGGDEWGGDEGKKIEWMNRCLGSLDAEITRVQKGRKEQNERYQFPIFDCLQLDKIFRGIPPENPRYIANRLFVRRPFSYHPPLNILWFF
ncbi:MAG: hypothetical protein ABIL02_03490, partial [candidate division WOR-3 bacterium]